MAELQGRYDYLKEIAFDYAFLLSRAEDGVAPILLCVAVELSSFQVLNEIVELKY